MDERRLQLSTLALNESFKVQEISLGNTFQKHPRVEGAPLNDGAILLDPTTSKFFMLNHTSAFIWERLSTPSTAESIAREMASHYDKVTFDDVMRDVSATLDEMVALELAVSSDVA